MTTPTKRRLSRRNVLKTGAAALAAGRLPASAEGYGGSPAAFREGGKAAPTYAEASAQAPAVLTNTQTGRPFRGLVRHDTTLDVQELRLLPTDPRQVVIRS